VIEADVIEAGASALINRLCDSMNLVQVIDSRADRDAQ